MSNSIQRPRAVYDDPAYAEIAYDEIENLRSHIAIQDEMLDIYAKKVDNYKKGMIVLTASMAVILILQALSVGAMLLNVVTQVVGQ